MFCATDFESWDNFGMAKFCSSEILDPKLTHEIWGNFLHLKIRQTQILYQIRPFFQKSGTESVKIFSGFGQLWTRFGDPKSGPNGQIPEIFPRLKQFVPILGLSKSVAQNFAPQNWVGKFLEP
jgi:hypothetical protein